MNRRAGATDRHALLAGGAYPSSSSLSAYRSSSPYDSNPYPSTSTSNGTYHSSDSIGAPKKEPPPSDGPYGGSSIFGRAASAYSATRTAEDLEEQNDQRLEGLTARVSMLKEITLNIGLPVVVETMSIESFGSIFSLRMRSFHGSPSQKPHQVYLYRKLPNRSIQVYVSVQTPRGDVAFRRRIYSSITSAEASIRTQAGS
ncbi:protein transport protein [Pseudozyma hubeiensis SY62]|uniref:Protein transport protein n=1 Tax=Pseudozyma hubeiensis (strain SY62) TaxID=1305764 RepID=R9P4Y2_PSEHS|nr:protein transport protein [Pseudozyma hubeiensis SY62]GAC96349.1 protein transport protein [Pseudozyma hubeiensis SY62]